jgi:hypothetical protein
MAGIDIGAKALRIGAQGTSGSLAFLRGENKKLPEMRRISQLLPIYKPSSGERTALACSG